ncbi:DUF4281-containing protein [Fragilaria crotonensis]|nr:DUF4281-containing protein [Fragilaria crotonensis]
MNVRLQQLLLVAAAILVDLSHAFMPLAANAKASVSPSLRVTDKSIFRLRHGHVSSTSRHALLDPMLLSYVTDPSPAAIQQAFSVATFFPQPFWLFLVLLPTADFTKKLMGGMEIVTLTCLIHFFIVATSIGEPGATAPLEEFSGVFDPSGNPQAAFLGMMQYPNFVSEEWSHVLTWDLFVGRWIWLDGLRRGVFTSHSVFCVILLDLQDCCCIGPRVWSVGRDCY